MYIEIDFGNDEIIAYKGDQIKSLSYAPECDQTMQTLPVAEFDVVLQDDVYTESRFEGHSISIKIEQPAQQTLAEGFVIADVKKISSGVYELKAKYGIVETLSQVDLPPLDCVAALRTIGTIIEWVFRDAGFVWSSSSDAPYYIHSTASSVFSHCPTSYFGGYAGTQNARERLRQICQAYGLYVEQGNKKLYIHAANDNEYNSYYNPQDPRWNVEAMYTYKGVKKTKIQLPTSIKYTTYEDWRKTNPGDENYTRIQIGETNDFPDPQPIYVWVLKRENTIIIAGGKGSPVNIDNNVFIRHLNNQIIVQMSKAYSRPFEYDLETANLPIRDGNYSFDIKYVPTPWDNIAIRLDDQKQYTGIFKRAEYKFGTTTRIRWVILTDCQPVGEMVEYTVRGVYKNGAVERLLWEKKVWLSNVSSMGGREIVIRNPVIESIVAGRLERFTPQAPSIRVTYYSTDTPSERIRTAYYTRVDDPG